MVGVDRREFLKGLGGTFAGSAAAWSALNTMAATRSMNLRVDPDTVRFLPEMESVVHWIETTPREQIFHVAVEQLKRGLSYRQLVGGLFLAGIRNVKPRPVGFKFHTVMVINSAHQLALDSPQADRMLPFFWALDNFKSSQAQDEREGDWALRAVNESAVPSPEKARTAFVEAMDRWDDAAADVAIAGLCRGAGAGEVMEYIWPYAVRDWQNIGHKIIFAAQAWRTLHTIGWQHAEPVMRSLVFGLLNGGSTDTAAPYATNVKYASDVRSDWSAGKIDPAVSITFLHTLRTASPDEAAREAVKLLNRGISADSIWDGIMLAAGEQLMRQPGIVSLHSTTAANSLHFAYHASGRDHTRLVSLLQAASWICLFREAIRQRNGLPDAPSIDELEADELGRTTEVESLFDAMGKDRLAVARRVLALAESANTTQPFIDAARHLIFTKGTDSHDYKFAAAAFEEFAAASPAIRPRLLAASVFRLRSSNEADSPLLKRTRDALVALG